MIFNVCNSSFTNLKPIYTCFCGKVDYPTVCDWLSPHCCDNTCGKYLDCKHECKLKCHPGPCPDCPNMNTIYCFCKSNSKVGKCGTSFKCDSICDKSECRHPCKNGCHEGGIYLFD